jgi:single-stranded-DNA-specific exonuclease
MHGSLLSTFRAIWRTHVCRGMTKEENYSLFKEAFEKQVQETIHPDLLLPEIDIDAEINFADITPKLTRILKQFEPFGR